MFRSNDLRPQISTAIKLSQTHSQGYLHLSTAIVRDRTHTSAAVRFTSFPGLVYDACLLLDMSTFPAQSCRGYREKRWTDGRTDGHTHTRAHTHAHTRTRCAQARVKQHPPLVGERERANLVVRSSGIFCLYIYKWKNHFFKMKGGYRDGLKHQKGRNKGSLHSKVAQSYMTPSLYLCSIFDFAYKQ